MGLCIFSGRSSDKLGGFNCSTLPAGLGGNGDFEALEELSAFNRVGGIPEEGGGRVVVSGEGVALLAAGAGGGGVGSSPPRRTIGGGGEEEGETRAEARRLAGESVQGGAG